MNGMGQPNLPLEVAERLKKLNLGIILSLYNLLMLSISLLILIDVPRSSPYEWFKLRRTIRLQVGDWGGETASHRTFWGFTTALCEVGAEIVLTQTDLLNVSTTEMLPVQLELMEENLVVQGHITYQGWRGEFQLVRVAFKPLDLNQHRQLVQLLFCRPGQWKSRCAPGELRSLWLLLRILLRPRVVFDRKRI